MRIDAECRGSVSSWLAFGGAMVFALGAVGAAGAMTGLAGCGQKGPLTLPRGAAAPAPAPAASQSAAPPAAPAEATR